MIQPSSSIIRWISRTVTNYPFLGPTTEGFYDTASLRSQKASQHKTVYQKETTLPKRRCPRRGKPTSRQRSEQTTQTKRCSKDEAVALRKNHVVRPVRYKSGFISRKMLRHFASIALCKSNRRSCSPRIPRKRFALRSVTTISVGNSIRIAGWRKIKVVAPFVVK